MSNLKQLQDMIFIRLKYSPELRDNDDLLYSKICEDIEPTVINMSFAQVMRSRKQLGLPAFESVSRCRRKLQHNCSALASSKDVKTAREEYEAEFRKYAKA